MAENLRLTLILQARDRAVEVIKRVGQGGALAADKLRQMRRFRAVARDAAIHANALQMARLKPAPAELAGAVRTPGPQRGSDSGQHHQGQPAVLHGKTR